MTDIALREAKRSNETHFTRVWKYLYEKRNVELSEFEVELLERWTNIWNLLVGKVLSDRRCVQAHIEWCKSNTGRISERTAYDDIKRAKALFGDPSQGTQIWDRKRMSEVILEQIEKMRELSDKGTEDQKIEAAKAINNLTRRYSALNGLEGDVREIVPRPAIAIQFTSDADVLKKQADELMEGVDTDE